jgi:hypothetical protein
MRGLLLTLSITPFLACAQVWCPPGATWTYTHSDGWMYDGMARYQYVGDTVMAGGTAQIISLHTEGHYWPLDTVLVDDDEEFFTRIIGDRVDLWNGAAFDTLYDFAAVPGDHWQLSTQAGVDPFLLLTVLDTGHAAIDGLNLRYLVTSLPNTIGADMIFERLGSLNHQFVPWALSILDAPNGSLRCYEDAGINYHSPTWPFGCESIAGVQEVEEAVISISPNPGTDHITLQLPPGPHRITVLNATGRSLLEQRTTGQRPVIHTSGLSPGIYLLRVDNGPGIRWVKE